MSVSNVSNQSAMKCILASSHGVDIDSLLYMCHDRPKPFRKSGEVLIQVKACALAPGDVRVLAGHCDYFQEPPGGFPYIPGGDVSGIVEEADNGSRFKKGDAVIAMFELPRPLNGLAEFMSVKESLVEIAPKSTSPIESATLPSSAFSAMTAAKKFVRPGDRVLVLGGSGGVGTFFVQLAKHMGASYVATTSTEKDLMTSLGTDKVINYQETNWWEDEELLASAPFDLIVDLAVGRDAWMRAKKSHLLKAHRHGGKFVAFTADNPFLEIHSIWQMFKAIGPMEWRMLRTKILPFCPQYIWHSGLDIKPGLLAEVAKLVDDGSMKVVLDPISPLSFTELDVKSGFHIMQKRHAHGKVVVSISS